MESEVTATSKPAGVTSTDEAEALADYRSVSVLALAGLAFGLASPLILVAPLLMALPLFGIAICLLALVKINASSGQLIGKTPALIGLALATASLAAAPSKHWFGQQLLSRQARPVAERWLHELEARNMESAFDMTTGSQSAAPPPTPGRPAPEAASPLEIFQENEVIQRILELGENFNIQFTETMASQHLAGGRKLLLVHYLVQPQEIDQNGIRPFVLAISMERRNSPDGDSLWRIRGYEIPDDTG